MCSTTPLTAREINLLTSGATLFAHSQSLWEWARVILGYDDTDTIPLSYHSHLNNDGSPLQLCITCTHTGEKIRLLGDPASHITPIHARHNRALHVLQKLNQLTTDHALTSVITSTLTLNLPSAISTYTELHRGTLWLAAPITDKGMALYINAKWDSPPKQWQRIRYWLDQSLPVNHYRDKLLTLLEPYTVPASVGIEGRDTQQLRYKVYFRLNKACSLKQLGIDLFELNPIQIFLENLLDNTPIAIAGLVFSIGFCTSTGRLADAKIDICGHCLTYSNPEWSAVLAKLITAFNLSLSPALSTILISDTVNLAFIGCGIDYAQQVRLNLYFKGSN